MRICLYSPYLPKHVGGGEKYLLDVAQVLAEKHDVSIAISGDPSGIDEAEIRAKYERFFDLALAKISFITTPIGTMASFLQKLWWTKQFDVMYYQTDGSLFFSMARRNILHIQVPLQLDKSAFSERLKLANWQVKNTNSAFTKQVIEQSWRTTIDVVHHPMIEVPPQYTQQPKEKVIVNVGRFFRHLHSKRQDVLVEMFKELCQHPPKLTKGWKLVLIGSVEDQAYATEISRQAKGLPIEIYHQISREELLGWYAKASIYWHAAGYDIDETQHPEKVEHFGISTVEAMACGCIPIVHAKGGQREVLGEQLAACGWQTQGEGVSKTLEVMSNAEIQTEYRHRAQAQAHHFGRAVFARKLEEML